MIKLPTWLFSRDNISYSPVRLPHNTSLTPPHYSSPKLYEGISYYKRSLEINSDDLKKRLFLVFEGAGHVASVFVNDSLLYTHYSGYTSFRVEITQSLFLGDNEIKVVVDSSEREDVPPFGFVIDYLGYGGLYREVFLDIKAKTYISNVFVKTPTLTTLCATYTLDGPDSCILKAEIWDKDNNIITESTVKNNILELKELAVKEWNTETPNLYTLHSYLILDNEIIDENITQFGFRTIKVDSSGFFLNGKKIFLRGLNRHSSWPYIGYAGGESLEREDARIIKEELCCNVVRTSHYPQSHYFIDECDKLGLLVFTEIPGWQHIGDENWKKRAIENTREMVTEYRNHPSIVIWGVRINESMDDDAFYKETNRVAHSLDDTRPTSGVRYIENSSLLEDIYSYNDFSHSGKNSGVKKKKKVTKNNKPLLISECNGHMFPTKSYDNSSRREEHALRHARVLNDAIKDGEHIGCIEWCYSDYQTHSDFGSGDRVCYHGVMDSFRNPKLASYLYSSQGEREYVLESSSLMNIGDYNAGYIGSFFVFTNLDEIKLYKNDDYVRSFSSSKFTSLDHGPIEIDDTIGTLLETKEGYTHKEAELIKECLLAASKYGIANLPFKYLLKLLWCMLRYHLKFSDGVDLFGKYCQSWGGENTKWRIDGIKDGKVVKTQILAPSTNLHLEVKASKLELEEKGTFDSALIRIRVLDEYDNLAPYVFYPINLKSTKGLEIIGPKTIVTEGGMAGIIVRTTGLDDSATLTLESEYIEGKTINFKIKREDKLCTPSPGNSKELRITKK